MVFFEIEVLFIVFVKFFGFGLCFVWCVVLYLFKKCEGVLVFLFCVLEVVDECFVECGVCGNIDMLDLCGICVDLC